MAEQFAAFSWSRYVGAVAFAAVGGGVLGFVISLLVELTIGRHLSDRIKGGIVLIGVLVGYAMVKVLLDGK